MTDKQSTRMSELERRLEYAKRIRKAFGYGGTADHEDIQSILKEFQDEVIREFSDNVIHELEELHEALCPDDDWFTAEKVCECITIVKGVEV